MKESFWGIFVVFLGVTGLIFIVLFQNLTNTDQHNSLLLDEVAEAAMKDSIDYSAYRANGTLKINRENNYNNSNIEVKEKKNLNYNYLCDKFNFSDTLNNRKNKSNYEEINNNFITADKVNIDINSEDRLPKDIIQNNKDYLINHEIKNVAFMFKKINFQNASSEPCLIKNKYAELF